ncbi:family 16 glycosylhydrolase [Kiritimatiellaeota bacterium B1221]|nr:family 16 glycosylhydrolase [Kiritimatiellaeota bacterium B1221]
MKYIHRTIYLTLINILWGSYIWAGSLESSTEGWLAVSPVKMQRVTHAEGAPVAAVTEGEACLELRSPTGGTWETLVVQRGWTEKIKQFEVLSFDLFVPQNALPAEGWAKIIVRLYGGSGADVQFDLHKEIVLDLKQNKSYPVEWSYVTHSAFNPDCDWAHLEIVKIASDGEMSPIYIDHIELKQAPALEGDDAFLSDGSWKLIWEDDFVGDKGGEPPAHWALGAQWNDDGTWRDATLSREEAYLDGEGHLVLRTRYVDGKRLAPYLVTSEDGTIPDEKSITFGPGEHGIFIEWRVNVSEFKAHAAWFALWLYSITPYKEDASLGSEIDVMEYVPFQNETRSLMDKFNAAIHISVDGKGSVGPVSRYGHTKFDSSQWHTWGLHWTRDLQVFYLDGRPYWENTLHVSPTEDHGLRMTIEIANGDPQDGERNLWGHPVGKFEDNPPSRLPSFVYVDYVRVFKKMPAAQTK